MPTFLTVPQTSVLSSFKHVVPCSDSQHQNQSSRRNPPSIHPSKNSHQFPSKYAPTALQFLGSLRCYLTGIDLPQVLQIYINSDPNAEDDAPSSSRSSRACKRSCEETLSPQGPREEMSTSREQRETTPATPRHRQESTSTHQRSHQVWRRITIPPPLPTPPPTTNILSLILSFLAPALSIIAEEVLYLFILWILTNGRFPKIGAVTNFLASPVVGHAPDGAAGQSPRQPTPSDAEDDGDEWFDAREPLPSPDKGMSLGKDPSLGI